VFFVSTLIAAAWYFVEARSSPRWPGGSSLPGFVFGIIGGLLCLFEFLIWFRKKVRSWKIGSAQAWLRAHIWLGLLTLPLLLLHSGFRFGGLLSSILLSLLILVVTSGVWGWVMQNKLPASLLEVPEETLVHQIDLLGVQLEEDAWTMVSKTCGIDRPGEEKTTGKAAKGKEDDASINVGLLRSPIVISATGVTGTQALASFFESSLSPFLLKGRAGHRPLAQPGRARLLFDQVRSQVPPETYGVLNTLEGYAHQRRQWDRQRSIHFWLHNWLWIHFPMSVALIVLMFVHVVVALKYY